MSIDTAVLGDPVQCQTASRRLDELAAALDATVATLDRRSRLPAEAFGGLSGAAFRRRTTTLGGDANDVRAHCAGLARALERLGRDLDAVESLMHRARQAARASLVVEGTVIRRPEPCAPARDQLVFDTVSQVVQAARRIEEGAQLEWQRALSKYAGTAPPLTPSMFLPLTPPIPLPFPPPTDDGPPDLPIRGGGRGSSPPDPDPVPVPVSPPAPDQVTAGGPSPSPSEMPTPGSGLPHGQSGSHVQSDTWVAEPVTAVYAEPVTAVYAEPVTEPLLATCGTFPFPDLEMAEFDSSEFDSGEGAR